MKDRLFYKGLITTILGLFIIIFAGLLMYQGKSSPSELSGWIGVGLMFLRANDSLLGIKEKEKE